MAHRALHLPGGFLRGISFNAGGRGLCSVVAVGIGDCECLTTILWLSREATTGNVSVTLENFLRGDLGVLLEKRRVAEDRLKVFRNLEIC